MQRRREWLILLALFAAGAATRLPLGSPLLYDHDSFLFARAAERYDLRLGQPHPPGYLFYVYLGKWLSPGQDYNRGFLILGALAAGLTAAALYALGRRMFDVPTGIGAGVVALFSPLMWFYGDVALSYAPDGALVAVIGLACWWALKGRRGGAYVSALVIGLAGGFRAWTALFAAPLWLYCVRRQGLKRILLGAALAGGACLTWLLPNMYLSGGPATYLKIVSEYNAGLRHEASVHVNLPGEWTAFHLMGDWMWQALGPALIVIAAYLLVSGVQGARRRSAEGTERTLFLALWIAPSFLFRLLVHSTSPGYALSYLPGLALLAGAGATWAAGGVAKALTRRRPASARAKATTIAAAVLWVLFAEWGAYAYLTKSEGLAWPVLLAKNAVLRERIGTIKREFPPAETVILADDLAAHARYYLRGYRVVDAEFERGVRFFGPGLTDPQRHARRAVVFDFKTPQFASDPKALQPFPLPSGQTLAVLPIPEGYVLRQEPMRFGLEPAGDQTAPSATPASAPHTR
jgi:4-amino-4-deoxy-L-arabinose transferase-like glycosyltransferase